MVTISKPVRCAIHGEYCDAIPDTLQWHHVWPLGMGGPDIVANRIGVCATIHMNIHKIIRDVIDNKDIGKYRTSEVYYAKEGVMQWLAAGKPGKPE
jgi:hypothetical protein